MASIAISLAATGAVAAALTPAGMLIVRSLAAAAGSRLFPWAPVVALADTTCPPTTSGGGTPPPTTSGGGTPPPTTSGGGTPPPTTSGGGTPPPTTSGGGTPPPTTSPGSTCPPPDTTPPILTLPADIATIATSSGGAVVSYSVSATDPDNLPSDLRVTCSPPSGSTFPIGTTTVSCTATDPAGNTTSGSFHVAVVDVTPPTITITSPTNTTYQLHQTVLASYSCSDPDSAVTTCVGTVPNGSPIDTASAGTKSFTVAATDPSGNASSQSVTYMVSFSICFLYDQTQVHQLGSTIPLKLQLCDVNGANLSSSSIVVHGIFVQLVSGTVSGVPVLDSGNANADNDFRFDPTLGGTGGYIFNLSTKNLPSSGTWAMVFQAGTDPTFHEAQFQIR